MLLGKLRDLPMVSSAFQENRTTGAWAVLTYPSPKTAWLVEDLPEQASH